MRKGISAVSCWLALVGAGCVPANFNGEQGDGVPDAAIVLETQGSFAFGGTVLTGDDGDTFHGDHGYVQFQVPRDARRYPLVMWHGGGQFSKTFETTPDGRDGYQNIFLRKGFATYILDQPGRGRAGRSTAGTTIPVAVPGEANLFTVFRLGIWEPPDPRSFFPGVQFSQDPETLNQYFRQSTPDTGSGEGGVTGAGRSATDAVNAVAALLDQIGPAILVTHSASGILGWRTALKSENVRAIVSYEPTTFLVPEGDPAPPAGFVPPITVTATEFQRLTEIPVQIVFGDNIASEPIGLFGVDLWVRAVPAAQAFVEKVNARGGDAEVLRLPDVGVTGNTHFPFSDLNNLEVAELLSGYLNEKGLDRR